MPARKKEHVLADIDHLQERLEERSEDDRLKARLEAAQAELERFEIREASDEAIRKAATVNTGKTGAPKKKNPKKRGGSKSPKK